MKNFCRLFYLLWISYKQGLFYLLFQSLNNKKKRYFFIWLPLVWPKNMNTPRGIRIRNALTEAGPIFVKLGQLLSTRLDLLPQDIGQELTLLQDSVPAFPTAQAITTIENSLHKSLAEVFFDFQETPLASASVAQVHSAKLLDGESVIIKILRPGIKKIIYRDLQLMKSIAKKLLFFYPAIKQLRPLEIIHELQQTLNNELDLRIEAANAVQLRRNFAKNKTLYIPKIYWPYCKQKILVMERIYGIAATNAPQLKKAQVDLKLLAERGVTIFFTQVFRDAFFHADMHAGNIFINATNPHDPTYIAVDFGIVGTLTPRDQFYLAFNLWAFFNRDYKKVADLHIESGWLPPDTQKNEFEMAIRSVCEPIFAKPLKEISFAELLLQLLQTARKFKMPMQPQLILLQKTLLNVEGMGRQLYPDLNLWDTANPFLTQWIRKKLGVRALLKKIKINAPLWSAKLPDLPDLIYTALQEIPNLKKHHTQQQQAVHQVQNQLTQLEYRLPFKLLSIFLGFSAIAITLIKPQLGQKILQLPWQSWGLFILATICWLK